MLAHLERFIAQVPAHSAPRAEPTLFALGGRGHCENPTSDLLAFFLRPDGEHGLGATFLKAFLECIPAIDPLQLSVRGVVVHREQVIAEGRIDLVVQGGDWCLIIENKIRQSIQNPLEVYERYAMQLCKDRRPLLTVLSPDGKTAAGWTGISYKVFCTAARRHLAESYFDRPHTKWHVFARELILHLENELYTPAMTPDQIAFVERHANEIKEVVGLAGRYREFLLGHLQQELTRAISGGRFRTADERWAIRCRCEAWGDRANIAFFEDPERKSPGFFLAVYAVTVSLSPQQETELRKALTGLSPSTEGSWLLWKAPYAIPSRPEAVRELCRIAALLSGALRVAPLPGPPRSPESTGS